MKCKCPYFVAFIKCFPLESLLKQKKAPAFAGDLTLSKTSHNTSHNAPSLLEQQTIRPWPDVGESGDPYPAQPHRAIAQQSSAKMVFQDCEESLQFLESSEGKEAIIGLHVDGILDFIDPERPYGYKDLLQHRR